MTATDRIVRLALLLAFALAGAAVSASYLATPPPSALPVLAGF